MCRNCHNFYELPVPLRTSTINSPENNNAVMREHLPWINELIVVLDIQRRSQL